MDTIDEEIVNDEYGGLATREARHRLKQARFHEAKEAKELRDKAIAVAIRKDRLEAQEELERRRAEAAAREPRKRTEGEEFIRAELAAVRQALPPKELKSCVADAVQVSLSITRCRALLLKLQFPDGYPQAHLAVDIASRTLSPGLLLKLKEVAAKECQKHVGDRQVLPIVGLIKGFLEANRLAPAFEDIKKVRQLLQGSSCSLKAVKEKSGSILVVLQEAQYFLNMAFVVPPDYPDEALGVKLLESNLPVDLQNGFLIQAQERARALAEPPRIAQASISASIGREGAGSGPSSKAQKLAVNQTMASHKKEAELIASAEESREQAMEAQRLAAESHQARPSLCAVIKFLLEDCLYAVSSGQCKICEKRLLPGDPANVDKVPQNMRILRLYCNHLFHFKCVEEYISSPPFGKGCPVCGRTIQHSKLVTDPKVLEQRWTHMKAREREIADVADFLS